MTTSMPADHPEARMVEVIQADREAAEQFMDAHGWLCEEEWGQLHSGDQTVIARAFARHRLRSTDQQGMLREALENGEAVKLVARAIARHLNNGWGGAKPRKIDIEVAGVAVEAYRAALTGSEAR